MKKPIKIILAVLVVGFILNLAYIFVIQNNAENGEVKVEQSLSGEEMKK